MLKSGHGSARMLALLFFLVGLVCSASAKDGISVDHGRAAVYTGVGFSPASQAGVRALRARAATEGGLRVFVRLGLRLESEDALSPSAAREQLRALASAQSALFARTLGSVDARHRPRRYSYIPFVAVTVDPAELDRLLLDPAVTWVGEVVDMQPEAARWNIAKIEVEKVWQRGFDGSGFVVAVLDNGMQTNHPMLAGRIVDEQCFSTNDPAGKLSSLCPNGKEKQVGRGAVVPCGWAACQHGTHVAAIAGGKLWNGLQGVGRGARLIVGQVFSRKTTPGGPVLSGRSDDVVSALERIYSLRTKHKIAAVNLSLGFGLHEGVCDAVYPEFAAITLRLREAKIATVKSSGNDGSAHRVTAPGCISSVIAVGATDSADKVAAFSNHASAVRLLAPGVAVQSAIPGGNGVKSGTSMAAAHVSGAFAVLRDLKPGANVDQILRALACTGENAERYGRYRRRINVAQAFEVLNAPPNRPRIYDFTSNAELKDWETVFGGWALGGGFYKPTRVEGSGNRTWTTNCNVDLDVTLDFLLKRSMSRNGNAFDMFLLTRFSFGISQTTGCRLFSGYSAHLSINYEPVPPPPGKYYIVTINRYDGAARPGCSDEGTFTELARFQKDDIPQYPRSIKVAWRGANITVYVDGAVTAKTRDTTYATGRIGVDMFVDPGGDNTAIDRVVIQPRDAPIPSAGMSLIANEE